jgi:hypothetical protein
MKHKIEYVPEWNRLMLETGRFDEDEELRSLLVKVNERLKAHVTGVSIGLLNVPDRQENPDSNHVFLRIMARGEATHELSIINLVL